jgi:hypothetical protein
MCRINGTSTRIIQVIFGDRSEGEKAKVASFPHFFPHRVSNKIGASTADLKELLIFSAINIFINTDRYSS